MVRSRRQVGDRNLVGAPGILDRFPVHHLRTCPALRCPQDDHRPNREASRAPRTRVVLNRLDLDRKSTRLNSSHGYISYAVFCLKKKKTKNLLNSTHATLSLRRHCLRHVKLTTDKP